MSMAGRFGLAAAALVLAGCTHVGSSGVAPQPAQQGAPDAGAARAPAAVAQSDAYSTAVLASGPLAYYRLDDTGSTAVDSSPNKLNGTIGVNVTRSVPGLVASSNDTAMNFPGVRNGFVVVPPAAALQVTTQVTMETFLRFSAAPKDFTVPLAYGSDIRLAPYDLYFRISKINARFHLSSGTLTVTAPTVLQPNTTYYIVATFDGTQANVYVNGTLAASKSKAGTITGYDQTHGFVLGDDAGFTDTAFAGTLDEVAIYGKALAASDVAAHFAAATSGPPPTPSPTPTAGPSTFADWSTYGFDSARTGYNPLEKNLGVGNVGRLALRWSYGFTLSPGDAILAQPVLAAAVSTPQGTHDIIYLGATTGQFIAFDAGTGAIIWQKQLGSVKFLCGAGQTTGVDRSAAFDRTRNRIYVEDGQNIIHALDMGTGAEAAGWPVAIGGTSPGLDFPHGGLNYNPTNHLLYATTASNCDVTPWHGRVAVVDTVAASQLGAFFTIPGQSGGGIWGHGGASIDPLSQNVFIAVGNADTKTGIPQDMGFAEHVVSLSSTLGLIGSNGPNLPGSMTLHDLDFGATPTLFQPVGCPPMAAAMNKSGLLVLYDRTNVGNGPLQMLDMNPPRDFADFIGLPAYSPATNLLYVPLPDDFTAPGATYKHGLAALPFQGCTLQAAPLWNAVFGILPAGKTYDDRHSSPTVANGVVYESDGPGQKVYAFNAQTGQKLWDSGAIITDEVFPGPLVDSNLYVVSYGTLYAFVAPVGLAPVSPPDELGTVHRVPLPPRQHHISFP
jgi:hypothetical protein